MAAHRPFVVVGESLVDIVVPLAGERAQAVGGSPMNVAVGLARLDVPTLLVTQVGDDEYGRWIVEHVRSSGAELAVSAVHEGRATSTATAWLDADNAATYDFDLVWDLAPQALPDDVLGLHVGSLGAALEPGRRTVLDLVRQAADADVFVSYDPNVRPAFLPDPDVGWHDLRELAAGARLVKLSDEDLLVLRPDLPVEQSARVLLAGATELVVLTHGAGGASAFAEGTRVDVPAPHVDVIDTVGAGDSFTAAVLAILVGWELTLEGPGSLAALDEDHLRELLAAAAQAAAVTCSRRGANPPTRRELPPSWPAR